MTAENTIHIDAPPPAVWRETVDIDRWPEWAPTVTHARRLDDGPFRLGSRAAVKQPAQPQATWTVTDLVPGERFSWDTAWLGLRMRATHALVPEGDGTRNTLHLEAAGALATVFGLVLGPLIRRALADENRGLKSWCERRPSQPPQSAPPA